MNKRNLMMAKKLIDQAEVLLAAPKKEIEIPISFNFLGKKALKQLKKLLESGTNIKEIKLVDLNPDFKKMIKK